MSGKAKSFRMTDGQKRQAESNIGLAWSVAPMVRKMAWWMCEDDVLSLCCEALCRAVVAHERRGSPHSLGSFVGMQAVGLVSAARSYATADCRRERRSPFDEAVTRYSRARPVDETVSDSESCDIALAAMSGRQKQAVKSYVMLEMSRSEAAEHVGCSSGSIDVHARRGIDRARKVLGVA